MGVADRIYENACECRDLETRVDRLLRDIDDRRAAARKLLEAIDASDPPAGVVDASADLRRLTG